MSTQRQVRIGGDGNCYHQHMVEFSSKVGNGRFESTLHLKDDWFFVFVKGLDDIPHVGTKIVIDGERWRVVEWTDKVECERVTN